MERSGVLKIDSLSRAGRELIEVGGYTRELNWRRGRWSIGIVLSFKDQKNRMGLSQLPRREMEDLAVNQSRAGKFYC